MKGSALRPLAAFAMALLLAAVTPPELAAQQTFDVILRGGRVLDGTGNPWFIADVALDGDRVAAVGDLTSARGRREIDAAGLYVAPGFIDSHSHAAGGLATEGLSHARPLLAMGITTVIVNPDGGGPIDLVAQRESLLRHGLGVNVMQLVPHGSVRRAVLGMQDRDPTEEELDRMKRLVRQGMEDGAFGLSSGTFYAPGSYSKPDEIIALARVVAEYGGAYTSHPRDESNYTIGVIASAEEVIDVGRQAGIPTILTHVKALGPPVWGYSTAIVQRISAARAEGVEVYTDQYPYAASATGLSAALLPRWAQAGGLDSLSARFGRPETMARIRAAMVENLARRGGADRIQFRRVSSDEELEGKLLSDIARDRGQDPIDVAIDLLSRGSPGIVSFNMHEADVRTLMDQPWNMTSSDGDLVPWMVSVPHPRSYGAFARKIRKYVVEEGVVGLAAAIRSMTSLPAQVFRLADRGTLAPGKAGDVVVFDLERIRDVATFTAPHALSEGMMYVFVNGEAAVDGGEFTDRRAGRTLRRP